MLKKKIGKNPQLFNKLESHLTLKKFQPLEHGQQENIKLMNDLDADNMTP
jgi:hypothetical protein